jgi:hypothetical protein
VFELYFEIRGVLSIKTCLEGGKWLNLTMHAPWCIIGCPSNIFHQTMKSHGGMWGKRAWKWLKEKQSSRRINHASKGVDESIWVVQSRGARSHKATKQAWVRWRKPELGGAADHPGRSRPADLTPF